MLRLVVMCAAVALCGLCVGLTPSPAQAVVGAWSVPLKISGDTRHAWFPDIAADDVGTIHVVWAAEYPTPPRLEVDALWYTRFDGRAWSKPTDIAVVYVGDALRNSLAVDSAKRLHLIYKGFGQLEPPKTFDPPRSLGPEDLWYTRTDTNDGGSTRSWSPSRKITRGTLGYFADLQIDSRGTLHAIWTEADGLGWGIYYANSADGGATWTHRYALDDRNFVWWYRAQLKIDAQDRLHVTWEVTDRDNLGRTRATFYARSVDAGRTWSKVQMGGEVPREGATNSIAGPQQPAIGVDGAGQVVFVYREVETDQLFFRASADGVRWSAAERLPGIRGGIYRPYDVYDMVTDSAGHVHLVAVAYPEGSDALSLVHLEWDGQSWRAPQIITAGQPFAEYPKVAISAGNQLHVVWFGGDRNSIDRLGIGIWYSSASAAAPRSVSSALPVPWPDVVAPAAAEDAPVGSTKQMRRRVMPVANVTTTETLSEIAPPSSLPIVASMLPVALLVSIVGVVCWRSSTRH